MIINENNLDNDEIIEEQVIQEISPKRYSRKSILMVFLVIFSLLSVGLFFIYRNINHQSYVLSDVSRNNTSIGSDSNTTGTTKECTSTFQTLETLSFKKTIKPDERLKNLILLNFDDIGYITEKTNIKDRLETTFYLDKLNQFVYLTESIDSEDKTYKKKMVGVYDLKTNENKIIFEYTTSRLPEERFGADEDMIRDIGISNDQSKVVILTNQQIWIYETATKKLEQYYSEPTRVSQDAFYAPKFSADNTKLLLYVGHYEGSSSKLFDFSSKTLINLPYSWYGAGSVPLGWVESKLLVYEIADGEKPAALCLFSTTGKKDKCVSVQNVDTYASVLNASTLNQVNVDRVSSGQVACNNIGAEYAVDREIKKLVSLDIQSGELKEILEIDTTNSVGVEQSADIIKIQELLFENKKRLFVKMKYQNNIIYGYIDDDNSFVKVEI